MNKELLSIIKRITRNLSKNMMLYTLATIILGITVGYLYNPTFLAKFIPVIVFFMIYPMMVNVSFESLRNVRKYKKVILLALLYNFVLAPIIYYFLCSLFKVTYDIQIALLLLAIAPASSMGIGYVGLAEGNVALASVIVASAFLIFIIVAPLVIHFIVSSNYIVLPLEKIIKNLLLVLVLPLLLGVITRELIIERRNIKFNEVKPLFSFITLVFLYILIFSIFALKGRAILENPTKIAIIVPLASLFYIIMLAIEYIVNKYIAKMKYEEFQAVVFTTVSKNVALTMALLAFLFGKHGYIMAIYPAIISLIQLVFLITYLHFSLQKRHAAAGI